MIFFKNWWCCLNPRESHLLALLLPSFAFAGSYVRQDTFYIYWAALGYTPENAMVKWFISIYALVAGEIPNGEEPPIPVFFFDLVWWSQFYAFSLTDDFACLQPCRILAYSNL